VWLYAGMSKAAIGRQRSLECVPVRRRSGTSPEGEILILQKCYMTEWVSMCITRFLVLCLLVFSLFVGCIHFLV
jgi:hypothetical protein